MELWTCQRKPYRSLLLVVLIIHALLLGLGICGDFVTFDELAHVPAGITHWQTTQYSVYRVNPPLPRKIAALPVLAAQPNTDGLTVPKVRNTTRWEGKNGAHFAENNKSSYLHLMRLARLPGILWSVAGALLLYCWASSLYKTELAGLLCAAIWCFEPNILAHAHVVTPDLPSTAAILAAAFAFWCFLRRPSWSGAYVTGLLLGVAQLTKHTCLVLYLAWPVVLALLWTPSDDRAEKRISAGLGTIAKYALIFLVSIVVINLGYDFEEIGWKLEKFPFRSSLLSKEETASGDASEAISKNRFRGTMLGSLPVPLPANYVLGLDVQKKGNEWVGQQPAYLRGEWRIGGWWYFYLYALAVKVPVPLLLLFLWSVVLCIVRMRASADYFGGLLVLGLPSVLILVIASSQTEMNRHMRYVLPVFPFLILMAGRVLAKDVVSSWTARLVAGGMVAWLIVSSLLIAPHFLGYYNELAGGPHNGHHHLLNSNTEWGQDLLYLQKWMRDHPEAEDMKIAFFHNRLKPSLIGMTYKLPPVGPHENIQCVPLDDQGLSGRLAGISTKEGQNISLDDFGPHPGYQAVSVSLVMGQRYHRLYDSDDQVYRVPEFGYAYYQRFTPIAKAGYSIFIYDISREEANAVREDLGLPPLKEEK